MSQNIQNEKKFFDELAEEKFQYSALKKKCFEKLFIELSKSIINKKTGESLLLNLRQKEESLIILNNDIINPESEYINLCEINNKNDLLNGFLIFICKLEKMDIIPDLSSTIIFIPNSSIFFDLSDVKCTFLGFK